MKKALLQCAFSLFVFLGLGQSAHAAVIYQNDFEGGSTLGFTGDGTIQSPTGVTQFLGYLSNSGPEAVLTLSGLNAYTNIGLSFDLYTINSMDGGGTSFCCGPDYFTVSTNTSGTLLNETFSNLTSWVQSYGGPGSPGGTGSSGTISSESFGTLTDPPYVNYTYHLSFLNIANNPSDLIISFLSGATQNWGDEGFGIDNIMITGDPSNVVPLPAALPLFAAGLGAMGFLGWRRRRRAPT